MSSASNRGRRGSGGYSKPRRYWESDDYQKRGHRDYDRGRGRRSRSRDRDRNRERSYSRSYSRSKSRSRSPNPSKVEAYQAKSAPLAPIITPIAAQRPPSPYDPVFALNSGWAPVDSIPPQLKGNSTNGQAHPQYYGEQQIQYLKYQQHQMEATHNPIPMGEYGSAYGVIPFKNPSNENYMHAYMPAPVGATTRTTEESSENSAKILKKNKEKKKKKRNSSSSSSSSSSSDSSTGSKQDKRRGKKKDSSDSSSDSSSEDEKKLKKKEKKKEQPPPVVAPISSNLSQQQKEVLEKQQNGYKAKLEVLQREIKRLVAKEDELASMKADIKLIEENLKLQTELKSRVKAVNVVLEKIQDVLRGGSITAEGKPRPPPPPPPKLSQTIAPPAPILHQVQHVTLVSTATEQKPDVVFSGLEFYDNGVHWCRLCNIFPSSVNELLDHFHSEEHHIQVEQLGIEEQPWHKKNTKETKPEPGARKVPFRGMQFFTPVKGWYCKICSCWMGDHHCSVEHLKSEEHHNSFMSFLAEHPDWESKYAMDREKARMRAGLGPDVKKVMKLEQVDLGSGVKYNPLQIDAGNEINAKSIFVQMRRKAKEEEETRLATQQQQNFQNSAGRAKEKEASTVDEWMGKPQKVPLDIIDTQKFAAIVRQKHGATGEKEEKKLPAVPHTHGTASAKDEHREREKRSSSGREETKSRHEGYRKPDLRVELTLGRGGGGDRDRGARDRDRRRPRSKSRSRSRGRYDRDRDRYGPRRRSSRDRSRSRSRERDRANDKGKEVKPPEVVKRLPIIGKMPLFGKKAALTKDLKKEDTDKTVVATSEYGPVSATGKGLGEVASLAPIMRNPYEASMSGVHASTFAYGYPLSGSNYEAVGYPYVETPIPSAHPTAVVAPTPVVVEPEPLKPPGEKDDPPVTAPTRAGLPDDFQHALDIIYHGVGGKPGAGPKAVVTFPPSQIPTEALQTSEEYSESSFNYMDFQPYQDSFEGYGPADYPDMETAPKQYTAPTATENPGAGSSSTVATSDGGVEDDIDDLRMLGIDVEDSAASNFK